jgi:hypothetical protein
MYLWSLRRSELRIGSRPLTKVGGKGQTREQQYGYPFTGVIIHRLGKPFQGRFIHFQQLGLNHCPLAVMRTEGKGLKVAMLFKDIFEVWLGQFPEFQRNRGRRDSMADQRLDCPEETGIYGKGEFRRIGIACTVEIKEPFDSFYNWQGVRGIHTAVHDCSFVATMRPFLTGGTGGRTMLLFSHLKSSLYTLHGKIAFHKSTAEEPAHPRHRTHSFMTPPVSPNKHILCIFSP